MTLSSEIGRLEDENTELKSRVHALEQQVAYQQGKLDQAEAINAKLQTTISLREQALAVYQLADKINAIEPMPKPQPAGLTQSEMDQVCREMGMPPLSANNGLTGETMPAIIRNAQAAKAVDRRVPRHNAA